jgi:hypothetical protein
MSDDTLRTTGTVQHIPVRVALIKEADGTLFVSAAVDTFRKARMDLPPHWDQWPEDLPPALVKDMPTLASGLDIEELLGSVLNRALTETLQEVLGVQVELENSPRSEEADEEEARELDLEGL